MDAKQAIAAAKRYLEEVYAEEHVTDLGLEEIEHNPGDGQWAITLGFSRPWNTPRTKAQELLETLGAYAPLRRTFKVVTIDEDGSVLSMKNRPREMAE